MRCQRKDVSREFADSAQLRVSVGKIAVCQHLVCCRSTTLNLMRHLREATDTVVVLGRSCQTVLLSQHSCTQRISLRSFLTTDVARILCWEGGWKPTAFTWCDCRWPWRYFKVIRLFHIKFLINGVRYCKSYYRLLIGNHTLAFDWCHFWWPWSTF